MPAAYPDKSYKGADQVFDGYITRGVTVQIEFSQAKLVRDIFIKVRRKKSLGNLATASANGIGSNFFAFPPAVACAAKRLAYSRPSFRRESKSLAPLINNSPPTKIISMNNYSAAKRSNSANFSLQMRAAIACNSLTFSVKKKNSPRAMEYFFL